MTKPVEILKQKNHVDRQWTLVVTFVLLVTAILVGREVYVRLIVPAPPLNFDEAAHSLPGYYIMRDVLHLDARAFWGDTHIQTLWPPGFSYLQAPILFLLGRTDAAARLFSYIMLVLATLMSIPVIWQIRPGYAPAAILVSGFIALSAPGWLSLGGLALQETPVALVTFVVFWCYLRASTEQGETHSGLQSTAWYCTTGVTWFFLFLTKFNYAAFALAALGLVDSVSRIRRVRGVKTQRGRTIRREVITLIALYAPMVMGLVFWFFGGTDIVPTAVKWRDFQFFVTNENSGYPFWSTQNLLFYVRAAADWLMPHPILALAALIGTAWAVVRIRHRGVTLLALYFVIGFVLATIHPLKADRYITPLFPSFWVLTGLGAADMLASIKRQAVNLPGLPAVMGQWKDFAESAIFVLSVVVIALASWITWLPRLQPVWYGDIADGLRAASNQIVSWQQPERPVLIIGTFGELSPPLFEWRLRPQAAFANGNIQYDAPPGDGSFVERVEHWIQANPGTQVTLIEVDKKAALYNTADMADKNAWRQELVRQFSQVQGYKLIQSVSYQGAGLVISYYLPQ